MNVAVVGSLGRRLSRFPAKMTLHGSRVSKTQYWENHVLVVVLVSESKGL